MYGLLAIVEAARQLRGESTGQVEDCHVALAHGNGGVLSTQCTVLLGDATTYSFQPWTSPLPTSRSSSARPPASSPTR